MSPFTMYMTSSLGSMWNSLRPSRPRATNATESAVCQRILTGRGELLMVAMTSAKLIELRFIIACLPRTCVLALAEGRRRIDEGGRGKVAGPDQLLLAGLPLSHHRLDERRAVGAKLHWADHRRQVRGGDGIAHSAGLERGRPRDRRGEDLDTGVGRARVGLGGPAEAFLIGL